MNRMPKRQDQREAASDDDAGDQGDDQGDPSAPTLPVHGLLNAFHGVQPGIGLQEELPFLRRFRRVVA